MVKQLCLRLCRHLSISRLVRFLDILLWLLMISIQPSNLHRPFKTVLHGTPYVTPHILHKNYTQAHDTDYSGTCMYCPRHINIVLCSFRVPHSSPISVIGRDLQFFSHSSFDMERIQLKRNAPVAQLYEDAIRNEGAIISSSGALINFSGKKTGRSPKDKRIVFEETSKDDIWWGSVNKKMDERPYLSLILYCVD
jgi:phosphoenolpyruvate carboxykinase (ATP)